MPKTQNTKRPRTVSIGGATYDLFLTMRTPTTGEDIVLRAGEKTKIDRVTETCGGGACNTAVGLARLGCRAGFSGVVGADQWGERLIATMVKEGVNTESATIVEGETSSFSIIMNLPSGERTILYAPGANEHLHDVTFDVAQLESTDCVYLNHLSDTACMIEDDIIATLQKQRGTHLTWNPGGCQIARGYDDDNTKHLLEHTTLLLLNKEEALAFTKAQSVHDALSLLVATGCSNVCITDGKHGVIASDRKCRYVCPVLDGIQIVDTTGAGDAFGVGATWALLMDLELPKALIAGTLNASHVLGDIGAQRGLLTHTSMESLLQNPRVRVETLH